MARGSNSGGEDLALVYIEWVDSTSLYGGVWKNIGDIDAMKGPCTITSIGFLLKETKDYVSIAAHVSDSQVSGDMIIPKVAITKRKVLNVRSK